MTHKCPLNCLPGSAGRAASSWAVEEGAVRPVAAVPRSWAEEAAWMFGATSVFAIDSSFVKLRGFEIGFETYFDKFVQKSVSNPQRCDEIQSKFSFKIGQSQHRKSATILTDHFGLTWNYKNCRRYFTCSEHYSMYIYI